VTQQWHMQQTPETPIIFYVLVTVAPNANAMRLNRENPE
jgi:hypothetical protein